MWTEFFKKKLFAVIGVTATFATVVGVYLYTRYLDNATVQAVSQNYYFLVSDSTHVEASAHQIVLDGGAGYLVDDGDREYVAISAYLTSDEAETVQIGVNEPTKVLTLGIENLYFRTPAEKKHAKKITGAFQALEDCIEILDLEIARLEKGATQESSKRILQTLKKQFVFLGKEYGELFSAYAHVCENAAKDLEALINATVYVKNLRYLQCSLCVSYVTLAEEFSI